MNNSTQDGTTENQAIDKVALADAREAERLRHRDDAKRATVIAAVVDGTVGTGKIITGAVVGSAALIADGIHSMSDLVTDGFVLVATHYGRQSPDDDHPYGHGRIETLATMLLGSVLIFVAGGIVWASLQRLLAGVQIEAPGLLAMLVALIALLSKEVLYHYTMRVARRTRSKLLEGNAWHHRSDVLSTVAVLIALIGAQFGAGWMDAVAAAFVGILVGKIGWNLLWESARELVDTALPAEVQQQLEEAASAVPGVHGVHDLRTRLSAGHALVDVHIVVDPRVSVSEAHEIGNEVSRRLRQACSDVTDVTFHIDPEDDEGQGDPSRLPGLPLRPEIEQALEARWFDLPCWPQIDAFRFHYVDGKVSVEVWLQGQATEVNRSELASQLKSQVADITWLARVDVLERLRS